MFDFNRCKGLFSNFKFSKYPYGDTAKGYTLFEGVGAPCFSPNSQFVYINYARRLYQFDVSSSSFESSGIRVATWDGFLDHLNGDTTLVGANTAFNHLQLAPNGKIYLGNGATARYMTEIEYPDKRGIDCNVRQHKYRMKTYMGSVPYYPNYKLGADTCVESGIVDEKSLNILVYPNPVWGYLFVVDLFSAVSKIELLNPLGQQIDLSTEETSLGTKLDLSTLTEGVYFLQILDKDRRIIKTEKILVDR